MKTQELVYKHKSKIKIGSLLLMSIGIALGYFYFGTEPQETIGGFLTGLGLVFFLISLVAKSSNASH